MTQARRLALLAVASVVVLCGAPLVGVESLPLEALTDPGGDNVASVILWQIRIPITREI